MLYDDQTMSRYAGELVGFFSLNSEATEELQRLG